VTPPLPALLPLAAELALALLPPVKHPPAMHTPFVQGAPSCLLTLTHDPFAGLQRPTSHSEGDGQTTGVPLQTPAWHVSICVHALPSSHAAPAGVAGLVHSGKAHVPVAVAHEAPGAH
jgi:hypothetical protein